MRIVGRAPGTLYLEVRGVPTSVIRYRYPLLAAAQPVGGVGLPVASLDDLLGMKLSALAQRGAARDFWDLYEIFTRTDKRLPDALAAFREKYAQEDIGHVVRSLVYFADAEAEPRPRGLDEAKWREIQAAFRRWVAAL